MLPVARIIGIEHDGKRAANICLATVCDIPIRRDFEQAMRREGTKVSPNQMRVMTARERKYLM
ncbi:hypothetical protein LguiA_016201 [Lonicera macranthoides]